MDIVGDIYCLFYIIHVKTFTVALAMGLLRYQRGTRLTSVWATQWTPPTQTLHQNTLSKNMSPKKEEPTVFSEQTPGNL